MTEDKNKVIVTINGKEYTIVASESQEYILSLSEYVNNCLKTVLYNNQLLNIEQASILTAINIGDDYLKGYEKQRELEKKLFECNKKLLSAVQNINRLEEVIDSYESQIEELKESKKKQEAEFLSMIDK